MKDLVLGLMLCCGTMGITCESVQGVRCIEGCGQLPVLPADTSKVARLELHDCNITREFIDEFFEGFDAQVVYEGYPLVIDLSRSRMSDEARECLMYWLRELGERFGCIYDTINLRWCGFSEEQHDYILENIHVARHVYF